MLEILCFVQAAAATVLCSIFETAYGVIFPVQISPSLYQGALISGYLACVGRGLRLHWSWPKA